MNEYTSRRLIAQAVGATGKIGTEKQFWTTVLTGLNNGVFSSANNEHEFWRKFAAHLSDVGKVFDGDEITIGGSTYTFEVTDGVITDITVTP